jgi:putative RecB family exonuclease
MSWDEVTKFDDSSALSASSIKTYLRCPKQFDFAYIKGIKTPPTFKMIFGRSIHKGLETNYEFKFKKKRDINVGAMHEAFVDDLKEQMKKASLPTTKTMMGMATDEGVRIMTKYHEDVAPGVQPIRSPELKLLSPVDGANRNLIGFVDLVADVEGVSKVTIRDTKTTSRMFTQVQADTDIQLTIYAYLLRKVENLKAGKVQFDVVLRKPQKKKDKQASFALKDVTSTRDEVAMRRFEEQFKRVDQGIRKGDFYPTDSYQTCAWCGYRDKCFGFRGGK